MSDIKNIHCCKCNANVKARLTNGKEVYPHRRDLSLLPFWICDSCKNFVGCHHKTKNKTQPLGFIATKPMKQMRIKIHSLIDPIWKNGTMSRKDVYALMSSKLGFSFHTSKLKTIEECNESLKIANRIKEQIE